MHTVTPIPPEQTDYHVHCAFDYCAGPEATLEAVYAEAVQAGLREICVIKHYSHELPNHEDKWVFWKRTREEDLDAYLEAFHNTPVPDGLRVLSGVETELLSDEGDINIPPSAMEKIDLVLVSNHWMPEGGGLSREWLPLTSEHGHPKNVSEEIMKPWLERVAEIGPAPYTKIVCDGNANAIRRHKKARVLAHLDDGFGVLRAFRIPVDELPDETLMRLAEPVMDACIAHNALWEITPHLAFRTAIVHEANRRGVRFAGTVDAHFVGTPNWGFSLAQHDVVEKTIRAFGLTRGAL